jgi:2-polyprenyl-3-methyl-5-hydroxy-6-metoxy-1,4-benzoquinol methylase
MNIAFNRLLAGLQRRKDRNQWKNVNETYANLMTWSWDELAVNAPNYFARLEFSVRHATGCVLEIGAGIGNMTRWLSAEEHVKEIYAIDGFPEAIDYLRKLDLPGVHPVLSRVDALELPENVKVDSLVACEVLEHLYKDEEMHMLECVRSRLAGDARFVLSTPIGWLDDPHHVRGFSKVDFIKHVEQYYGPIAQIDYRSGYSQVAVGAFRFHG